ncbi:excinuclease ABC subunit UvrC [Alkaliphilus transvaalensis]|uniref:excinuclease ABC subunit UvrC n=1 Tax=Alkaliphilus transvaalensis TaxID=114628 RepID=UPI000686C60C|nr:excinuclease ABC subunit UvrC [Alkaliphilus transvaalensis]
MFDIKEQLKILPDRPGVYIMKNLDLDVIYVGKAISLRNRVRQYFQSGKNQGSKVRAMVANINSFEYIVTDSELEALILECNLIKKYRPKYNVLLRDDKTYPYIKVTLNEAYPRVIKTRRVLKDKGKYFGPYTNIGALNQTLEIIHQLYPIRDCKKNIDRMIERKERPCLNYHIKKCMGPCTGEGKKDEYNRMVEEIITILNGKENQLIKTLETKMKEAAREMDFEKAASFRDQLLALENTFEKQKVVTDLKVDQDVIAMATEGEINCGVVFFIREGKLIHREPFTFMANEGESREELLTAFIKQFYNNMDYIPKEILLEEILDEEELLQEWLSDKRGSKVQLRVPQRGDKKQLMEMAKKNATTTLMQLKIARKTATGGERKELVELQELLGLDEMPIRIESYDISNISGLQSVGSMIVFEDGKAKYSDYRRFKIKTISGPNDYGSLEEILERRFSRGLLETQQLLSGEISMTEGKFLQFPDLIMVDGGFGQVTSVKKVLDTLSINIPVCGMIKDDKHKTRGIAYEGEEIILDKRTPLFRLIFKIQEEVHRFALAYHKTLRKKTMLQSELEEIKGIGEARRKALMKHFGEIQKIKTATLEDLLKVEGMNKKAAESIINFYQESSQKEEITDLEGVKTGDE